MKSIIFIGTFFLLFLLSLKNIAQDSSSSKKHLNQIYLKVNFGYGYATGSGQYTQVEEFSDGSSTHEVLKTPFSLGKGGKIGGAVGYMVNDIIGLELDLSVLLGGKNDAKNIFYRTNSGNPYYNYQSVSYYSNAYRINPCLLLTTKNQSINVYGKTGLIISFSQAFEEINESVEYINGGTASGQFDWNYKGGFGVGTSEALGLSIDYVKYIKVFAEISFANISTSFRNAVRTTYTINGIDQMNTLSTYNKEIIFTNKISDNTTADPDSPKKQLKDRWSTDSIGFNVGFLFLLH
jgi:hypothetical protein